MSQPIYSHKDSFYLAFEERFRGSVELIRSRLKAYVGFLEPLRTIHGPGSPALDLGCGRGEWLLLLTEYGFSCHGVDLDEGMLESCHKLGLSAEKKDALAALEELPDNSQSIVSGFHIAEHLPFETLMLLVEQVHRVLKPGGLLILETPNPENLRVGATSFYLDPSHERPLPSPLLAFLGEFYGFERVKILRLQEDSRLRERVPKLLDVLQEVSPDYAVVAQKTSANLETKLFDTVFSGDFGVGIEELAQRYDDHQRTLVHTLVHRLEAQEQRTEDLVKRVTLIENRLSVGPFRLRQLIRHPGKFFSESFGRKSKAGKPSDPGHSNQYIAKFEREYLSIRWIVRQPGKAIRLFTRQPRKVIGFIIRNPGRFLAVNPRMTSSAAKAKFDRPVGKFGGWTADSKPVPLFAHQSSVVVAVDLTPMTPGGGNGGIKHATLALLDALGRSQNYDFRFLYITSSISHHEVRAIARPQDKLVCVNHNGPFAEPVGAAPREWELRGAPDGFLGENDADLLYCPFGDARFHRPGLPTMVTVVDLLFKDWPHSLTPEEIQHREQYVSRSITRSDRIICNSRTVMERVRSYFPESEAKLFYSYQPIHERLVKKIESSPESRESSYFFFPANYWKHKNHEILLISYGIYRSKAGTDAWEMLFSGAEDARMEEVRGLADTLGLSKHVRFMGFVTDDELTGLYANAGALVFPSLHEGFGIPPVEAMSFGIPMIIGDVFSAPEICGDACIKIDPRKPLALAEAMLRLSTDRTLADGLVKKGSLRLRLFNLSAEAEKLAREIWLLVYPHEKRYAVGFPDSESSRLVLPTPATPDRWTFTIRMRSAPPARVSLYFGERPFGSYSPEHFNDGVINITCEPRGEPLHLVTCGTHEKPGSCLVLVVICQNNAGEEILLYGEPSL